MTVLEKDWDATVWGSRRGLAPLFGWDSYHTLRSKGSKAGFPDRVAWQGRVIYVEMKKPGQSPTRVQTEVLTALARAGAEVYVWLPDDFDEAKRVLSRVWYFRAGHLNPYDPGGLCERRDLDSPWTPKSLWTPAGHRYDA